MGLESCMLLLDNSEYMRNGDFAPTRFQAQAQAVNTIFTSKNGSNPESAVGIMTMAGKAPQLLATPTNDIGKLFHALSRAEIGGTSDLATSVQIAQLALKHRENKNQRQRIVVFVGSPLNDTKEALEKLGKKLRKNNVVVDVVTFGDEGQGEDGKMQALVEAAGKDECNLVSVPAGSQLLADVISSSPILFDPESAASGGGGGGGSGGDGDDHPMGDIDPNMDPELAMAIRMSLQEAAERTQREEAASASASAGASSSSVPAPVAPSTEAEETTPLLPQTLTEPLTNAMDGREEMAPGDGDDEDDAMLQQALAMSRGEAGGDVEMEDDDEDEDAAIARAIELSMQNEKEPEK